MRKASLAYRSVIRSFRDKATAASFLGRPPRRIPADLRKRAREKLDLLHSARSLEDLRMPPGNRLESLTGIQTGQYSIRVGRQWRLCFRWQDADAFEVELVDHHD